MRSADRFFLGLGIAVVVGLLGTSAFNPDSGFLIHSYVLLANLRADVRDRLGAVVHRGDPRRRDQRVQTPPLAKLLTKTRLSRAAEPCEHAVGPVTHAAVRCRSPREQCCNVARPATRSRLLLRAPVAPERQSRTVADRCPNGELSVVRSCFPRRRDHVGRVRDDGGQTGALGR
jgi:hypothetical protein